MARDIAISVEGLSKSYLLGHDTQSQAHSTLRDRIVHGVRDLTRKTRDMARGRPIVQGDTLEEFWALQDVSFEIPRGARVGILGRNGAGKSTLLKLLSRITEPTKGRIAIDGRVASLLEVGTGFHPELSGRENIFLNGAILGMSRAEVQSKFDEIVAFAEIDRFIDTPVKRYSSGMYVRLAFAVAAHIEPEILIVDEVLAVGDAKFQQKCIGKMEEVSKQGRTILFVSHNIAAVRGLCNHGILLEGGRLTVQGTESDVIDAYNSRLSDRQSEFKTLHAPKADVLSIQLCDEQGGELATVTTDTPIAFTITYRIKQLGIVNMVLNLSRDGAFVFQSINNFDVTYSIPKQPGTYVSRCLLPGGYLNNGIFTLSMTVFEDLYDNPVFFSEVLSFVVDDGPGVRGDYIGPLLGALRPRLYWSTEMRSVEEYAIS